MNSFAGGVRRKVEDRPGALFTELLGQFYVSFNDDAQTRLPAGLQAATDETDIRKAQVPETLGRLVGTLPVVAYQDHLFVRVPLACRLRQAIQRHALSPLQSLAGELVGGPHVDQSALARSHLFRTRGYHLDDVSTTVVLRSLLGNLVESDTAVTLGRE